MLIMGCVLLRFWPGFRHENTYLIVLLILSLALTIFIFMRLI